MEEAFKEWQLESLTIVVEIEKGKVKGIKIKEYKGKDCKKELLEKILKRLHFPASIKGSLELNLEYI